MIKVEWGLEGETNVDDVVNKTNKGLNGIEKNAKRVENAFTMSASSFFLKFLGPMALLQMAISSITESMAKAKQTAEDGFNTLAAGEDKYASAQEARMAAFFKQQEDEAAAKEKSAAGRKAATEKFIDDRGFWRGIVEAPVTTFAAIMSQLLPGVKDASELDWVQKGAAEDWAKAQKAEGKKMEGGGNTATSFKSPEGFGNVIGVGANPVLEAVTLQTEIQRQMLAQLEIANGAKANDTDFTKPENGTNYRATPYGL
jgi:hypothetical protein